VLNLALCSAHQAQQAVLVDRFVQKKLTQSAGK
jgi:hypothetical protein